MGENVTIMAYYPQYGNQPSMRHSSVADDAAIAAAFQAELDAENNLYSKPKENTMRDSEVARSFQAEENAKADGTFKVVSRNPMQYRVSPNYNEAAGSMRDSEFARILQGQEESRAGVQPGAA